MGRASLLIAFILILSSCTDRLSQPRTEIEAVLGTSAAVTLYDRAPAGIFEKVFSRVREIEHRMTLNEDDSELVGVNEAAGDRPVEVSPDTFTVISSALEHSKKSAGAFDLTVGPLVKLWGIGSDRVRIPSPREIEEALGKVDYTRVELDPRSNEVYLARPGMIIDLGAIAKGYAADEAARILRENRVGSAIIDFGGNILALGEKPNGTAWRVGIQNPEDARGTYIGVVEVKNKSVVTSGVYERFFERDGVRYHHILDTGTGYPVDNELTSVTIVTDGSMIADAFSTSAFALGLEEGRAFVEAESGVEAIFITRDRKVHTTKGLSGSFTILDDAYSLQAGR